MRASALGPRPLKSAQVDQYDVLVGALGYEMRSRRIPMFVAAGRTILLDLKSPGDGSYDENRANAEDAKFELADVKVDELGDWLVRLMREGEEGGRIPRLAIDVSSVTRDRIARLVEGIRSIDRAKAEREGLSAVVDLLYTPARPPVKPPGPELIEVLGPVTPSFAGFAPDPTTPVIAFVGLGIEQDRAIGALEYIEPAMTWAFLPFGEDSAFDQALESANSWVWKAVPKERRIFYRVDDPFGLFATLEQLVFSELAEGRPILVPLGPKIFAACCMLVASQHARAGVWRVTPGHFGHPQDCDTAGKLVGLRLELGLSGAFA